MIQSYETRATLDADARNALDDSDFAYIDSDGDRHLPIHDEAHVRAALSRFGQTAFDSDDDKTAAAKKIVNKAKSFDIEVDPTSEVGKAAGMKETKSQPRPAPATRAERRAAAGSFDSTTQAVSQALNAMAAQPNPLTGVVESDVDLWIYDIGSDWVVYQVWSWDFDSAMFQISYSIDADGVVTFDGEPQPVTALTTTEYTPVERQVQKNSEQRATECKLCDGSGKIREGNVTCPDCAGTGQVSEAKAAEQKSSSRPPRRRTKRSLTRLPEIRRFTSELRTSTDPTTGEIVLRGTPIVYNQPYDVWDPVGQFRETMRPGVAEKAMRSADFDCKFLFDHKGLPLARSTSGTLSFEDGPVGLVAIPRLSPDQSLARDLAIAIERRDVTQMSCGFVVERDEWGYDSETRTETRDVCEFAELFDVSAVTYPASTTTTIEVAERALRAMVPAESRERIRRLWSISKEIREGKVLSQQNGEDLMAALEALHSADDVDLSQIATALSTVDSALDAGQQALSAVLGRANPDDDDSSDEEDEEESDGSEDAQQRDRDWLAVQKARAALRSVA
jgi:uncharacterized protein